MPAAWMHFPLHCSPVDCGHAPLAFQQNVVATVNLECKLDLKNIALHARNAEYNPKRFAAVIMRIREPKSTALIFHSGVPLQSLQPCTRVPLMSRSPHGRALCSLLWRSPAGRLAARPAPPPRTSLLPHAHMHATHAAMRSCQSAAGLLTAQSAVDRAPQARWCAREQRARRRRASRRASTPRFCRS